MVASKRPIEIYGRAVESYSGGGILIDVKHWCKTGKNTADVPMHWWREMCRSGSLYMLRQHVTSHSMRRKGSIE